MPLTSEEISGLTAELSPALAGARIGRIHSRDPHSVVLSMKLSRRPAPGAAGVPRAKEGPRRLSLFLSARPGLARVHLIEDREASGEEGGPFAALLRELALGARVRSLRQRGRGLAVELDLEHLPAREATPGAKSAGAAKSVLQNERRADFASAVEPDARSDGAGDMAENIVEPARQSSRPTPPQSGRQSHSATRSKWGAARAGPRALILVVELSRERPNLVLLDRGRRLLGSLRPVKRPGGGTGGGQDRAMGASTGGGTGGALATGEAYERTATEGSTGILSGMAPSPWRYLPDRGPGDEAPDGGSETRRAWASLFPLNAALGRYYLDLEGRELRRERLLALRKLLAQALARRRAIRARLDEDLEGARAGREGLRFGELLKGEVHRLRRGMTVVEVVDYFSPGMEKLRIPLDPALTPQQNVERWFRRYRKSERAAPIVEERIGRIEGEASRIEALLARAGRQREGGPGGAGAPPESPVASPDDSTGDTIDEAELARLEAEAAPLAGKGRRALSGKPAAPPAGGPRRFTSIDGLSILVGKNARENDEVTFRLARGNDIFLHVSGRPGSHVVVAAPRDGTVPLETLLDAAQLALYFSLPRRGGGEPAAGAAADVDYAPVKHVRKPRGAKPGSVLLARHRTLRVRLEPARLDRLRGGTGAEGAASPGAGK